MGLDYSAAPVVFFKCVFLGGTCDLFHIVPRSTGHEMCFTLILGEDGLSSPGLEDLFLKKVFLGIVFRQSVPVHGQDCWSTCS